MIHPTDTNKTYLYILKLSMIVLITIEHYKILKKGELVFLISIQLN